MKTIHSFILMILVTASIISCKKEEDGAKKTEGLIAELNCVEASFDDTLFVGDTVSGVSISIPYLGVTVEFTTLSR